MLLPFLFRKVKTAIKRGEFEEKREIPWFEAMVVISIVASFSYLMTR